MCRHKVLTFPRLDASNGVLAIRFARSMDLPMRSASPVTDARSCGRASVLARTSDPLIIASDLTLMECDRVLHRTVVLGSLARPTPLTVALS